MYKTVLKSSLSRVGKAWNIEKQHFHVTRYVEKRKSGASAFEEPTRDFSKKQKKRKLNVVRLKKENVDHAKSAIKQNQLEQRWESPRLKEYVEQTRDMLANSMNEVQVPDGISLADRCNKPKEVAHFDPYRVLKLMKREALQRERGDDETAINFLSDRIKREVVKEFSPSELSYLSATSPNSVSNEAIVFSPWYASMAAIEFAKLGEFFKTAEILDLMKFFNVPKKAVMYTRLMAAASSHRRYDLAESYFETMLQEGLDPDLHAWTALIHAKAMGQNVQEAINVLNRLESSGAPISMDMFNCILQGLIKKKSQSNDKVQDFWMRMHALPDLPLNKASFNIYLRHCTLTQQVERAFFSIDEMKVLNIDIDTTTFLLLFRACAEAPHWVNGYQDTIVEAMRLMEGAELLPTPEIYNAIIYGFGRACDSQAAEFYFWEMRRKGLKQDSHTYSSLLNAYARTQTVGASRYGSRGRFVRTPDRPLTVEEKAQVDIGVFKSAAMMSDGLSLKENNGRGNPRQRQPVQDMLEDYPEAEEEYVQTMIQEAQLLNRDKICDELEDDTSSNLRASMPRLESKRKIRNNYVSQQKDNFINPKSLKLSINSGIDSDCESDVGSNSQQSSAASDSDADQDDNLNSEVDWDSLLKLEDMPEEEADRRLAELIGNNPVLKAFSDKFKAFTESPQEKKWSRQTKSSKKSSGGTGTRIDDDAEDEVCSNGDEMNALLEEMEQLLNPAPNKSKVKERRSVPTDDISDAFFTTAEKESRPEADGTILVSDSEGSAQVSETSETSGRKVGGRKLPPRRKLRLKSAIDPPKYSHSNGNVFSDEELEFMHKELFDNDDVFNLVGANTHPFRPIDPALFEDPFESNRAEEKQERKSKELTAQAQNLVDILDANSESISKLEKKWNRKFEHDSNCELDEDDIDLRLPDPRKTVLPKSVDHTEITSMESLNSLYKSLSSEDIESMWDMVEFGRPPTPDYSERHRDRVQKNIDRAELVMADLINQGIQLDEYILTPYLSVYANAARVKEALQVMDKFNEVGIKPTARAYRALVKMYIKIKDLTKAVQVKENMISSGVQPDSETYGALLETYTHREMIVEALKELEEASSNGLKISERQLKVLRNRCRNLNITHPDMPPDPLEWVKRVKDSRRRFKNASQRNIQGVKSAMFA